MSAVVEKEILNKSEQADKIVRNYSLGSIVPSLLPVPMLDLVAVTGIQLKMLQSLAHTYGVEFKQEFGRSAMTSLIGGTVALSTARVVSSAVKAIPIVGSLVGAAVMPVVNGSTTYAIGKVFTQHFESGGTFLTFDAAKVRAYFEAQLKEGKAMITAAQEAGETSKDATAAAAAAAAAPKAK
jgi:uncharacterized protein (DUF697 family)